MYYSLCTDIIGFMFLTCCIVGVFMYRIDNKWPWSLKVDVERSQDLRAQCKDPIHFLLNNQCTSLISILIHRIAKRLVSRLPVHCYTVQVYQEPGVELKSCHCMVKVKVAHMINRATHMDGKFSIL